MAARAIISKEAAAAESAVIHLAQVERVLVLYLHGLLGLRVAIFGVAEPGPTWGRLSRFLPMARSHGSPPLSSYTDGVALHLPAAVGLLLQREDNLRLFKSMAVLCAAQILQGSLAYVRWFVPSAEKRLALDLFGLLENARLERVLCGVFKGLAADFTVLRRQSWEERTSVGKVGGKDALVEALVQHLLLGTTRQQLAPSTRTLLDEMVSRIDRRPPSLALDAARTALELAESMQSVRGTYHPRAPVLHWPQIRPEMVLSARQRSAGDDKVEQSSRSPIPTTGTRSAPENARPTKRTGGGTSLRGVPRGLAGARASSPPRDSDAAGQDQRIISGAQPPQNPHSGRTVVEPSGRNAPAKVSLGQWTPQAEVGGEGEVFAYDEWDYRIDAYRSGTCLLRQEPLLPPSELDEQPEPDRGLARHIRRQFELLRSERRWRKRELDGEQIDLDAVVEAVVDRRAGCSSDGRLYIARSERVRDIAAALLVDLSASTETWVRDVRRVVDVERDALLVISAALEAVGDFYAIYGFSSKVEKGCAFYQIKGFGEKYGQAVRSRIQMLTGRGYTRMGVPIRHATRILSATEARVKLLLVLSDGKPNEVGIYQGQYAVEDTRRAVLEARERGIFPFGLTIDRGDRSYLPRIFGPRGYAVIDDVLDLPLRLADVYRRLTT